MKFTIGGVVIGMIVPMLAAGHIVLLEGYCEPNCERWHQPHAPHEFGSSSSPTAFLGASAFQTTSS